jgi:hypothetical protein
MDIDKNGNQVYNSSKPIGIGDDDYEANVLFKIQSLE